DSTRIKEGYKEVKENVLSEECHGLREKKGDMSSIKDSINIAVSYDSSNYYTITQKQSTLLRHQSSSLSLDSTITPETTDSESKTIDSYIPNINANIMLKRLAIPIDLLKHSGRKTDNNEKGSDLMEFIKKRLDIFNNLGDAINKNVNSLVVKNPLPLLLQHRRHILDVSSVSLSFFKKEGHVFSEAICRIIENDNDDDNNEFDLFEIDHAGEIPRKNSSPVFISSASSKAGNQHLDEYIHVDGFSYMDESVEEEYYDTSHPEKFEITEHCLTSSLIDSHLSTFSTFSQDKQRDDEDILQDYEEL
ncbi:8832_t:CDS:2, partial [Gigaspora margarita]